MMVSVGTPSKWWYVHVGAGRLTVRLIREPISDWYHSRTRHAVGFVERRKKVLASLRVRLDEAGDLLDVAMKPGTSPADIGAVVEAAINALGSWCESRGQRPARRLDVRIDWTVEAEP